MFDDQWGNGAKPRDRRQAAARTRRPGDTFL
jgi:hypothetical protein